MLVWSLIFFFFMQFLILLLELKISQLISCSWLCIFDESGVLLSKLNFFCLSELSSLPCDEY